MTNPLTGEYQIPGWTELNDHNNPYSLTKKEQETKDRLKKVAEKSLFQKTGAIVTTGKDTRGIKDLPEHKQKAFKEDYAKFYGVNEGDATKLDYNKLYQASREAPKDVSTVPKQMQGDN